MKQNADVKAFVGHTEAEFEKFYSDFSDRFMDGMKDVLKDSSDTAKKRLSETLKRAASLEWKAKTAKDEDLAKDYQSSAEDAFNMAKLVMYGEAIVVSNQTANVFMSAFRIALSGLIDGLKVATAAAVSGVSKGLLASIAL